MDGYEPTKTVLMETFCEGIPVLEFVRQNSATNREILSQMCHGAIEAVCQMIFLDNFCHGRFLAEDEKTNHACWWLRTHMFLHECFFEFHTGDLHPGNVLVSPDHKFVLLDVGIVMEHSHEDHILISDVLAAFIRCEGRKAGRIMIDDSNSRLRGLGDRALEEERYIDKIEMLTIEAKGKAYLMHKLGTYITYICNAAAQHHVMLNQTFISAALCVKVQEGIALAMDPSIEIWRVAIPIILEGERRNFSASRAKELLGVESIFEWVFGGDNKSKNGGDRLKNT